MTKIIRKHPLASFFIVGILICFGTLFPAIYALPQNNMAGQIISYYLSRIAVYSPVIASIFITRVIYTNRPKVSYKQNLQIILPVWLIALTINVISLKTTAPPEVSTMALIILSIPVAFFPAWVINSAVSGSTGVRKMLASLVNPKGNFVYYLIALFTFPFVTIIGAMITNGWNGNPLLPQLSQVSNLLLTIVITFLSVLLFSGGLNEEAGWRGFAQVRLQAQYSPLVSVLVLWLMMVIWHIPNDLLQYQNGGYLLIRIGLYPFITLIFAWIFNRTKGNIWVVAIFHASMNSMNPLMGIFPMTLAGNALIVLLGIFVLFKDRMWQKLPKDHPAIHHS